MRRLLQMLGRLLLAPMFVHGGYQAASEPGHRAEAAARIGLPQPEIMVRLNGVAMVLGGIALALGIKPRWAAALLAFCLVPRPSPVTRTGRWSRDAIAACSGSTSSRTWPCSAAWSW
jgi:hypothetical protein